MPRSALACWSARTARFWDRVLARPAAPAPGVRLGVQALEDRLTPAGPTFDYSFTEAALGSIVTVYGQPGQPPQTYIADHLDPTGYLALATCVAPPDPVGAGVQGYWSVKVTLAPGWRPYSIIDPVLNYDGLVYNAVTFTIPTQPDVLPGVDAACPPELPGLGGRTAPGNDNHQTTAQTVSPAGVGYYDGRVNYAEADAASDAFASPFGQSREWAWGTGRDYGQHTGNGWSNPNLPTLRRLATNFLFVNGPGQGSEAFYHDPGFNGPTGVPLFADQSRLTLDVPAGKATLTDELGDATVFYYPAAGVTPPERAGQMKRYTDRNGAVTEVTAWTAGGAPAEVRRADGPVVESWQYAFGTTPLTSSLITAVAFSRSTDGGTTFAPVQAVEYAYYGLGDPNGSRNDLRSAVVRTGGPAGTVVKSSYYRYYTANDPKGREGSSSTSSPTPRSTGWPPPSG